MSSTKKSNPKDMVGGNKFSFTRLPMSVVAEVSLALHEGARKYGAHNWRVAGVQSGVYIDGCLRHLMLWQEGQDIDPDSGLNHVTKAIAGLMVLRDGMIQDNWVDTRPPNSKMDMTELNDYVLNINCRYPNPVAPFLQTDTIEEQEDE